jgi:hypothetical protein
VLLLGSEAECYLSKSDSTKVWLVASDDITKNTTKEKEHCGSALKLCSQSGKVGSVIPTAGGEGRQNLE